MNVPGNMSQFHQFNILHHICGPYRMALAHSVFRDQEEIAKDLLSGDDEETQSSADDLTPSVTSHETTDFFPRTLRCKSLLILLN